MNSTPNNNKNMGAEEVYRLASILMLAFCFIMIANYMLSGYEKPIDNSNVECTLCIYETTDDFTEYRITNKHITYNADGSYYYTVSFRSVGTDDYTGVINCNIPAEYEEYLDEEARFKAGLKLAFVKEAAFEKLNLENLDNISSDISRLPEEDVRALNIDFMWSEFIVDGLKTEDELREYFSELYHGAQINKTETLRLNDYTQGVILVSNK